MEPESTSGFGDFIVGDDFGRYGIPFPSPAPSPRYLQLEITNRCNLRCPNCPRRRGPAKTRVFPLGKFSRLLDALPLLDHVSFVGAGESLLAPDFPAFVRLARERGVRSSLTTNGLLARRRLAAAVGAGLGSVAISVDAADASLMAAIRPGVSPRTLIRAIKAARDIVAGTSTQLSGALTLSEANLRAFPEIVSFLARQGITRLSVESLHHWGEDQSLNEHSLFAMDPGIAAALIEEGLAVARAAGMAVSIFDYRRLFNPSWRQAYVCPWPWDALYVTSDGDVTPCCVNIESNPSCRMGNVWRETISEIWPGPRYQDLRQSLRTGHYWPMCQDCVYRAEFGRPSASQVSRLV